MEIRTRWLSVFFGFDFCRQLDCMVFVGFGPMTPRRHGLMASWPFWFQFSWNWLPTGKWYYAQCSRMPDANTFWSPSWTGRDRELVGWTWPCSFQWGVN